MVDTRVTPERESDISGAALISDLSSRLTHVGSADNWRARFLAGLSRMRWQLLGALGMGVLAPSILADFWSSRELSAPEINAVTLVTLLAVLCSFLLFRKVSRYPGVDGMTSILPVTLSSFAFAGVFILLAREDYSRFQLLLSFGLTTVWLMGVQRALSRATQLSFAVLPAGRVSELLATDLARWVPLSSPEAAMQDTAARLPIVADLRADMGEHWERFLTQSALKGRPIYHYKQVREALSGRSQIEHLSENSFGTLSPDILYVPSKKIIDAVAALVLLAFISPVLIMLALAIRLESPGPAIFRQQRIGLGGQPFTIYKFRSMRQRASGGGLEDAKTKGDDARVTRIGRFIRRHRIDELPQLINIVRGEMSFIGPRPEAVELSEWYNQQIPFYAYRHLVRPGISGWAQVNQGHITELDDAREKLEYDFYYVRHITPWLDFYIVLRTLRVLVTGHGAK